MDDRNVPAAAPDCFVQQYTTSVLRGAKAKDAFPEFIKRKGLATG